MSQMFQSNKTLLHVDLGSNGLKVKELQTIGEGLKDNHTILGLHMMGNELQTDALGFLYVEDKDVSNLHIMSRIQRNLLFILN